MKHVDPDVIEALKSVAAGADLPRVVQAKERHKKHDAQRFETQMQLLVDEVERVCPRDHPLFELVLLLAVARKLERTQQEPEFKSFVDFPPGW